ncbi:hypothetical protein BABINDRAFT_72954 [Babjeviella inositovora NRRL Y-12698]|uniref:V-type proton ATPase subunit E n=1 Tax=Babjeviella inositovora NRRL Y-12698 TaxID=984486 RepID=A0A1E3QXX9_9ASCO|nr:uncharacterized protein BABINDRAFT_72954 [Babjeviella inositovora NRRL Y-12698]ODQ82496.1 hypothetical protein BABINDRAFT_72954 [Babjeviella inositovora NRRL Y-12698]
MSAATALSNDQVASELRKMEAFIKKEAQEKAEEIKMKADEEYQIEKSTIVRNETASLDTTYQAKLKKAALAQQITKSTIANKTRLKILSTREEVLNSIFDDAEKQLQSVSADKTKYKPLVTGLIEEGLLALLETEISLRVREADISLVKECIPAAVKTLEDQSGLKCEVKVLENDFLSADLAGGIVIINSTGKIEIDNTLEERLKLLSEESLPAIRLELYGPSATRKFFD